MVMMMVNYDDGVDGDNEDGPGGKSADDDQDDGGGDDDDDDHGGDVRRDAVVAVEISGEIQRRLQETNDFGLLKLTSFSYVGVLPKN